jgi:glycerophosphoryl diester phosphodiesterase
MNRRQMLGYAAATPLFIPSGLRHSHKTVYKKFLIEAHRGNSVSAPENTLPAIEQAINIGVDRVEIDLQFSNDNKPVVIHDDTLDRTTNGTGLVAQKTYEEIKSYDAGSWKSSQFKGTRVPLLHEVFELCKGKCMVNIDLKTTAAITEMVRTIKTMKMENDVVITGKVPSCVKPVRDAGLNITMFYESAPAFRELLDDGKYVEAVHFAVSDAREQALPGFLFHAGWINPEIVYLAHRHGLAVNVYDVNTIATLDNMMEANVDGIMTDDPKLIKQNIE